MWVLLPWQTWVLCWCAPICPVRSAPLLPSRCSLPSAMRKKSHDDSFLFFKSLCVVPWLLLNLADGSQSSSLAWTHCGQFWVPSPPFATLVNYILGWFWELLFLEMVCKSQRWHYFGVTDFLTHDLLYQAAWHSCGRTSPRLPPRTLQLPPLLVFAKTGIEE